MHSGRALDGARVGRVGSCLGWQTGWESAVRVCRSYPTVGLNQCTPINFLLNDAICGSSAEGFWNARFRSGFCASGNCATSVMSCHALVLFSSQSFADKAEPAQQSAAEAPAVGTPDIGVTDAKAELTVFKVRL